MTAKERERIEAIRSEATAQNPEALSVEELDSALIGYGGQYPEPPVLIYDYDKCISEFIRRGMSCEQAIEWMDFNVAGVYLGKGTPMFIRTETGPC